MIRNSLICKLINVQASMKENKEKKIKSCDEISKLIKALIILLFISFFFIIGSRDNIINDWFVAAGDRC